MSDVTTNVILNSFVNNNAVAGTLWTSLGNAAVSDGTYASNASAFPTISSQYLLATKTNSPVVSPDSIINGVTATVKGYSSVELPPWPTLYIDLMVDNVKVGTSKSAATTGGFPDFNFTFGNSSDLWGASLKADGIIRDGFGLGIYEVDPAPASSGNTARYIDYISLSLVSIPGNMMMAM